MSKMTLEQVRDELHMYAIENTGEYNRVTRLRLQEFSNAIDAELMARGEPVAWLRDAGSPDNECHVITTVVRDLWIKAGKPKLVERYTIPLFTAPPAPKIDDAMVERARSAFVHADDGGTGITDAMRAALEAALKDTP